MLGRREPAAALDVLVDAHRLGLDGHLADDLHRLLVHNLPIDFMVQDLGVGMTGFRV